MEQAIANLNQQELKIIQLILNSGVIHYSDIERSIGRSRKTISKYLDNVESALKQYDVQVIRKRNVGVYLEGNTTELTKALQYDGYVNTPRTSEERVTAILSKLLLSDQPQTIQALAEMTFVSRSTLETDFKAVKRILAKYSALIETTHAGMRLIASESAKRKLMSELLTMYWGNTKYMKNENGEVHSKLQLPTDIQSFFGKATFAKVIQVLDEFEQEGTLRFTDYEFQSLAIHLIISMERISKDAILEPGLSKVKLEANTQRLVGILERVFQVKIPGDEQQYLNIHILAAEGQAISDDKLVETASPFQQNSIRRFLKDHCDTYDDALLQGLTVHLTSALKRLYLGLNLHNPYTADVKRFFPRAFNEAIDLSAKIEHHFNVTLNEDEVAYVALHLEAFLERQKSMVRAVIVCSTGLGTARLLEQRVKTYFSDSIQISRVTSIQDLKHHPISEDLVISTINFDVPDIPVVIVSPFLDVSSVKRLKAVEKQIVSQRQPANSFMRLLSPELIHIATGKEQRDDVINRIGQRLAKLGYGRDSIGQAAIKREQLASTAMDTVAVPHAPIEYVLKPCISVYINADGIDWHGTTVNIVFFLAMNKQIKAEIEPIYQYFNDVLEDKKLLHQLIGSQTANQAMMILGSESDE